MGNKFVTPNLDVTQIPELMDRTFIVVRTSGAKEDGWYIKRKDHKCEYADGQNAAAVKDEDNKWRIFMVSSDDADDHACGWRRLETIKPSTGWKDNEVDTIVQKLEKLLADYPPEAMSECKKNNGRN